jgi:hypothetical protein
MRLTQQTLTVGYQRFARHYGGAWAVMEPVKAPQGPCARVEQVGRQRGVSVAEMAGELVVESSHMLNQVPGGRTPLPGFPE